MHTIGLSSRLASNYNSILPISVMLCLLCLRFWSEGMIQGIASRTIKDTKVVLWHTQLIPSEMLDQHSV